jgi:hypothetical protein
MFGLGTVEIILLLVAIVLVPLYGTRWLKVAGDFRRGQHSDWAAFGPAIVMGGGVIAGLGGNELLAVVLLGAGICSWLGRTVAIRSKKNLGGLVGLLLGPIGVIVAAVLKDER